MKKSLIALAVLGAVSGAASAQSNVTMYGIVDVGVQYNERGTNIGTTAAPVFSQESVWGIDSGIQSGSRLGVRGSEALGRNWSAIFDLEMGFDVSTGMSPQGGRLFGRQAYGGFRHTSFGSLVFGRIATPSSGTGDFDLFGPVDPFGTGFGLLGLQATFIPSSTLREDNSVAWASPTWAGFRFGAQYSANLDLSRDRTAGHQYRGVQLGVNWTWGPLFLAATYDVIGFARNRRPSERRQPRPEDAAGRWRVRLQVPEGARRVRRPGRHQCWYPWELVASAPCCRPASSRWASATTTTRLTWLA